MGFIDSIRRILRGASPSEPQARRSDHSPEASPTSIRSNLAPRERESYSTPTLPGLTPIGKTDPLCPHCGATLPKMPGRKTRCRACGAFMYVRTRPSDRKRVLLVEADPPLLEAQWALVHGTSELSRFDEPGLSHDQQWAQCNKDLVAHAKNADWGLYRNTRLHMATLLHRQQRF